ncbi:SDR family NAD(P)-dependent oxidoreductase [Cupriavidus numazuensis]|uniref:Dihydroanticapsin 7-dehydrogenase n=1 Tax=Cupriavidus numazuensis TaxID=221992 RepID=A0ABM8TWJ9_9BURK|nr:SDR family oxidoreductase [Cupriavidus numazuensis]CAG2161177.1 Dihydroanticapsin 7-dehydrogenase [Cupriavidus numazuensis]
MTIQKQINECTVLVTGGTSGSGLATAMAFAKAGAPRIALIGRDFGRGEEAREKVGNEGASTSFHSADVRSQSEVETAIDAAVAIHGPIDILINCAGVGGHYAPLPFIDQDPAYFPDVCATSFFGILYACRAVLPMMRNAGFGVIVNTGSDAGKVPTPGETVIGGMMAAVAMFSRCLAMEAARFNVRVHALSPSIVQNTRSYDMVMEQAFSEKLFRKAERRAQLGIVQPEDLAAVALFLASPEAARLTGQVISVNGGISAG